MAERGVPLRGGGETVGSPKNDNYLGLLELLTKFDPFLSEHINIHGKKGKGHTSYLSKDVCEEFISLIEARMLDQIISEIKKCKCYLISLDSTSDSANVDQLTLIARYVLPSGPVQIVEKSASHPHSSDVRLISCCVGYGFKMPHTNSTFTTIRNPEHRITTSERQ